jgi:hypothetical protein
VAYGQANLDSPKSRHDHPACEEVACSHSAVACGSCVTDDVNSGVQINPFRINERSLDSSHPANKAVACSHPTYEPCNIQTVQCRVVSLNTHINRENRRLRSVQAYNI